jgi:hypothetical protein
MIKIPNSEKRFLVTTGLDARSGAIEYTKNIDFDEEGYVKLSPPMVKIYSSEDDAGLDLPIDVVPFYNSGSYFKILTTNKAYNITPSTISVAEDTGIASNPDNMRAFYWVSGLLFVGSDDVYSFNGSAYTQRVNLQLEFLELFANRNTIVGTNTGSVIKQYDTSYANTVDLTIPANYDVKGIAYNNHKVGIIAKQSKNQGNGMFYVWDGSSTASNQAVAINDSFPIAVAAFKSSWIVVTLGGQVLYFNGGGFDKIADLPPYYFNDDLQSLPSNGDFNIGKTISTEGDVFYANLPSFPEVTRNNKAYRPFYSGGVYCYDPKVSLYHKYAPSYSSYVKEDGTASSDVITMASAHFMETGDEVWLSTDDQGLTGKRIYYAIKVSSTTLKLADTYEDAISNTSLTITDGTITLWFVKRKDFGIEAIRVNDLGCFTRTKDYEAYQTNGLYPYFLGSSVRPNNVGANRVYILNTLAPMMSNQGYLVTKFESNQDEDMWQKVIVKHKKLKNGDKIIIKAKHQDFDPIIIGDSTAFGDSYSGDSVTWDSSGDTFTTGADLSTAEVGDEVHIFDGCGAGQSAHIQTITAMSDQYSVELDEVLRGIENGKKSLAVIDRYKKYGTITSSTSLGNNSFIIGKKSKDIKCKVVLAGVDVKIEEIQMINSIDKPSV